MYKIVYYCKYYIANKSLEYRSTSFKRRLVIDHNVVIMVIDSPIILIRELEQVYDFKFDRVEIFQSISLPETAHFLFLYSTCNDLAIWHSSLDISNYECVRQFLPKYYIFQKNVLTSLIIKQEPCGSEHYWD